MTPSWTFYSNPICDSITLLLILISEVSEFYIGAYRYPGLFLQRIGEVGSPALWQKKVCLQTWEVSGSSSVQGKRSHSAVWSEGWGEGVSGSVGSQQFGIHWIPPHWQPLGLMSGPPKEFPTCHPLQQHKGASCAIFLSSQEGFSALCSAWLPTQDATTVVSLAGLLSVCRCSLLAEAERSWTKSCFQNVVASEHVGRCNIWPGRRVWLSADFGNDSW